MREMETDGKVIAIHPQTLAVKVVSRPQPGWIIEPTTVSGYWRDESVMRQLVFQKLFQRYAREDPGRARRAKIAGPDPWLIALAHVLWQGIAQGFAWDVVKVAAARALGVLREAGLAPGAKRSRTEMGFFWTDYATDQKRLRRLFVGLRRTYESRTPAERRDLSPVRSSRGRRGRVQNGDKKRKGSGR